ncbi:MAG: hypothetical protein NWQ55_06260 [Salibacteraceae bacterium]|nr:hypothetical protein [Salibacteraceae bacterium]
MSSKAVKMLATTKTNTAAGKAAIKAILLSFLMVRQTLVTFSTRHLAVDSAPHDPEKVKITKQ